MSSCRPIALTSALPAAGGHSLRGRLIAFRASGQQCRQPRRLVVLTAAAKEEKKARAPLSTYRPPSKEEASLRAEAEAPFRSLRLVLFGFGTVSATLATLFGLPLLIGALAHGPNAKPLLEALQDTAINVGALGTCAYLTKRDYDAREKQIARLMREDLLAACKVELANKRVLRLAQLRGFARVVMLAGSESQVAEWLAAAEPFKEELQARGVLVLPLPIVAPSTSSSSDNGSSSSSSSAEGSGETAGATLPPLTADDLRWRATAIRLDDWREWFELQARLAGKDLSKGLYVSLRLDGRVRGSGVGCAPWDRLAVQLPQMEGTFGGLLDGMDGKV